MKGVWNGLLRKEMGYGMCGMEDYGRRGSTGGTEREIVGFVVMCECIVLLSMETV